MHWINNLKLIRMHCLLKIFNFSLIYLLLQSSLLIGETKKVEIDEKNEMSDDCRKINSRIREQEQKSDFDITIYQNLSDHCAKTFEPWFNYAVLLVSKHKYSDAKEVFERALSLKSDQEADLGLAFTLLHLDELSNAKSKFEALLKENPENVRALQGSAECFVRAGDLDKAYEQINKSLTIDPENPTSYFNLAAIEKLRNNVDRSIQALQKTLELNPTYAGAALQLAIIYRERNQTKESLMLCKQALADQSNLFAANYLMASLYLDLNDGAQAIYWFKKSLSIKKDDLFAILGLAEAYNSDQQASIALDLLNNHSQLKEQAPFEFLKIMGKVYMSLGKFFQAKTAFEEALFLQPKNTEVKKLLEDVAFRDR